MRSGEKAVKLILGRSDCSLVLLYHRVALSECDPQLLCVRPERFERQVKHLVDHVDIVPLGSVLERSRDKRVAITFDDGYADNAETAAHVLESAGAPATFFVTAGAIDRSEGFWWDRLEDLLLVGDLNTDHLETEIAGRKLWVDLHSPAGRERAYWALHRRLRPLPAPIIEEVVRSLYSALDDCRSLTSGNHRILESGQLQALVDTRLFAIGAHSVSHPLLASLPPQQQREEIFGSRHFLEQLTGGPVTCFSYPYGGTDSFDESTVQLVEMAGYSLACANHPGRVCARTDRFRVPRHIVLDWDQDEFACRLERWFEH